MRVTIRAFGIVADLLQRKEQTIDVPDDATVARLFEILSSEHPAFAGAARQIRAVVNGQTATLDRALVDGDEIGLTRAIGGGS